LEYSDWWNPILEQPLEIRNGYTATEGIKGTGVDWNEREIKKYII
jgi:mandelate racemase